MPPAPMDWLAQGVLAMSEPRPQGDAAAARTSPAAPQLDPESTPLLDWLSCHSAHTGSDPTGAGPAIISKAGPYPPCPPQKAIGSPLGVAVTDTDWEGATTST